MSRNRNTDNIFANIDWVCIILYVALVLIGWMNIYSAAWYENKVTIFDFHREYGKQFIWIVTSFILALIILILDSGFFTVFAFGFYGLFLVLNFLVPFLGKEVNGSRSWFRIGDFGIQPAEFMKFAVNLALAKFLSNVNLQVEKFETKISSLIRNYKNTLIALIIIQIPMLPIKVLQDETGLAIVFVAFLIPLYREGLSVLILIIGLVFGLLFIFSLAGYKGDWPSFILYALIFGVGALYFLFMRKKFFRILVLGVCLAVATAVVKVAPIVYEKLPQHQRERVDVFLYTAFGVGEVDLKKAGFNVDQSMITIGCGGATGTGYMEGAQTNSGLVPEQHTDFIFCTIGEEWGFIGASMMILLQVGLIIRLIFMAERQRSDFSRIYGYGVASVLFFHVLVNIGMTVGLVPVIGIPLPFISYGGSSLWSFTILLFIFIKLDANRLTILR